MQPVNRLAFSIDAMLSDGTMIMIKGFRMDWPRGLIKEVSRNLPGDTVIIRETFGFSARLPVLQPWFSRIQIYGITSTSTIPWY